MQSRSVRSDDKCHQARAFVKFQYKPFFLSVLGLPRMPKKKIYFYARALIQRVAVSSRAILANLRCSSCPRALSTLRGQFWARKKSPNRSPVCALLSVLKPFCAQSESALYHLN